MANRIQLRRGTAAEWAAANPVLAQGEPGIEKDTGKQKFGDGVTAWSALPYASKGDPGPAGIADDASVAAAIESPLTSAVLKVTIDAVATNPSGVIVGTFQRRELARLAPLLRQRDTPAVSALTLTYAADASPIIASSVTWGILGGPIDLLSCVPLITAGELDGGYVRNAAGRIDTDANRAVYGVEWVADGNTEMRLRAFYAAVKFRLYVDDVPAQADVQTANGITLAGGTNFRVGITHPNPGVPRRFRLMIAGAGLRTIYTAPTTSIYAPKVKRVKVAIVGTSFSDNSGSVALLLDSWVWHFAERYGLEVLNCARSGSGYAVDGGGGTHGAQVPVAIAWKPDLTIAEGSGNDVSATASDIQTAAAAAFAALEATGTPVVAVGMLPRGASGETAGPAARVITYTKAAADAAPNVLAYIDTIGTVDPLPTYTTGASYTNGSRVKNLGTTWQARAATSNAPATFDRTKWVPLSWNFGTGRVGAVIGDGNRDITVQADDLHPTSIGSAMIAANIGPRIVGVIAEAVSTVA